MTRIAVPATVSDDRGYPVWRSTYLRACFCFLVGILCADPAHAADRQSGNTAERDPQPRRVHWEDGLHFSLANGFWQMKLGGQAQIDTAAFADVGDDVELENGGGWRRARLYTVGSFGKRCDFKFQWDFVGSNPPNLKDAYLGVRFLIFDGRVRLRAGRFTTTFGLENDGSSNDTLFLEQGLTSVFVPPQENGILLHSESSRRRWDISFSSGAKEFDECFICDVTGISGRYSMGFDLGREDRVLHVGGNLSRRWTDESISFTERPESHIAPMFVDTGPIQAELVDTALIEGAFLHGPFSVQAEYAIAGVESSQGNRPVFNAFYAFGSYALTGEMRRYSEGFGTIRRISPRRELRDGSGGVGAFEIGFRFSRIDLNDQGIKGGTLNDLSFAFNWYPTRPTRASFNVIRANREASKPVWIFQARLQLAY